MYLLANAGTPPSGTPPSGGALPPSQPPAPGESRPGMLQPAVVSAGEAVLRAGPGTSYDPVVTVPRGTAVTILSQQGDWYRAELPSGTTGWIWKPLVELSPWSQQPPSSRPVSGRAVVGYYVDEPYNPSYDSMIANADRLTAIAPWAWVVAADGSVQPAGDPAALGRALRAAGSRRLSTYALVHNYQNGTFDSDSVHRLLSDPQARRRAVENLALEAARYGVTGINLDFENVPPSDREALSAFVRDLAERLHRDGRKLTVATPAKSSDGPASAHFAAFDYEALGRYADGVWLMTYDQHYRTGPPGPIASVEWVEKVVRHAVSRIPSHKILLGLPAYGYEWGDGEAARALTYAQAMSRLDRLGATLRWHPTYKVPYFTVGSRHVWFENRYSAGYKLLLVGRYELGGIAIWRLGQEDPGMWDVIARSL